MLEDILLLHKRHFHVDLRELRLTVSAEILVAEATGNLIILVHAADHQHLLENLRRLRQGVELAGMHAAGDKIIARAFGGGFAEHRRFNAGEAVAVQVLFRRHLHLMAEAERLLQLRTAQIQIAVFHANIIATVTIVFNSERRSKCTVKNVQFRYDNFYFAGRNIRILI